jgi:hypothetical protein
MGIDGLPWFWEHTWQERVYRAELEPDASGDTVDLVTGAGALPCPGPPGAGWRCINLPWHEGPCRPWSEHPLAREYARRNDGEGRAHDRRR